MKKILIAEDDSSGNILLKRYLIKWGYEVVTAFDGLHALEVLQEEDSPRMAILDWMMPGMDGLEVCRRLRALERRSDRYTYVMILTARDDKEDVVTGMEAGADDYLVKPFDKAELHARIKAGQRITELHEALRYTKNRLTILSRLDPLTGALSRPAILEDLDLAMYRSKREKKTLALSFLDIDHLKDINERFGRGAGDAVLQETVRRIGSTIRRSDYLGRLESDAFLVILLGVNEDSSCHVCRRMAEALSKKKVVFGDHELDASVSCRLTFWDGQAGVEEFVALAQGKGSEAA